MCPLGSLISWLQALPSSALAKRLKKLSLIFTTDQELHLQIPLHTVVINAFRHLLHLESICLYNTHVVCEMLEHVHLLVRLQELDIIINLACASTVVEAQAIAGVLERCKSITHVRVRWLHNLPKLPDQGRWQQVAKQFPALHFGVL